MSRRTINGCFAHGKSDAARFLQEAGNMSLKTQILIYLVALAVFDTLIPLPITALILIHVLYQKPRWFREWVETIYRA